jgi:hypothetical protein
MADFGSNFIDAFSAVYGAGMKKKSMDIEEKRAAAADERAQVDFDYTQKQRRNQETVQRAIAGAGNVLKPDADTSGAMNESQMQGLRGLPAAAPSMRDLQYSLKYGLEADPNQPMTAGAPAPTAPQAALPNAAPAPVPTPAPVAPAAPQAALPGTAPPPPQVSGQPPAQNMERFTGKNATLPAANAPIPVSNPDENGNIMTVAPDAQVVSEKQVKSLPNPDDYVQTTLNGRTVYVPKDKVTVLSGGDLAVAQGNAILRTGFDPQLGQTMIANGMKIQADTIAATADKYQRAVLASQATGNLDGLKQAWDDLYPAAGKADITEKDGQITVSHYIQTADGKKVTVGDPEVFKSDQLTTAKQKLFSKSMAMGSPQAMREYNAQQSQDIVQVATLVNQKLQYDLDVKRTDMAIKTGEASIRASNETTAAAREARQFAKGGLSQAAINGEATTLNTISAQVARDHPELDAKAQETLIGQRMAYFYNNTTMGQQIAAARAALNTPPPSGGAAPTTGLPGTPSKPNPKIQVVDDTFAGGLAKAIGGEIGKAGAGEIKFATNQWRQQVNPAIQDFRKELAGNKVKASTLGKLRLLIKDFPDQVIAANTTEAERKLIGISK